METIKETVQIGNRILVVSPKTAFEIRHRIIERLKRDAKITEELRREKMLPSGSYNQTARWTKSSYSRNDSRDTRVINQNQDKVFETRFANSLRREWSV